MRITLSTMNKLIQMGKKLGFMGQSLQEFVKQQTIKKQQQSVERTERYAGRGLLHELNVTIFGPIKC